MPRPNGELIRALREAKEWTQDDLQREAGVSRSYISYAENGRTIGKRSLAKIAIALGKTREDIELSDGPDESPEEFVDAPPIDPDEPEPTIIDLAIEEAGDPAIAEDAAVRLLMVYDQLKAQYAAEEQAKIDRTVDEGPVIGCLCLILVVFIVGLISSSIGFIQAGWKGAVANAISTVITLLGGFVSATFAFYAKFKKGATLKELAGTDFTEWNLNFTVTLFWILLGGVMGYAIGGWWIALLLCTMLSSAYSIGNFVGTNWDLTTFKLLSRKPDVQVNTPELNSTNSTENGPNSEELGPAPSLESQNDGAAEDQNGVS